MKLQVQLDPITHLTGREGNHVHGVKDVHGQGNGREWNASVQVGFVNPNCDLSPSETESGQTSRDFRSKIESIKWEEDTKKR